MLALKVHFSRSLTLPAQFLRVQVLVAVRSSLMVVVRSSQDLVRSSDTTMLLVVSLLVMFRKVSTWFKFSQVGVEHLRKLCSTLQRAHSSSWLVLVRADLLVSVKRPVVLRVRASRFQVPNSYQVMLTVGHVRLEPLPAVTQLRAVARPVRSLRLQPVSSTLREASSSVTPIQVSMRFKYPAAKVIMRKLFLTSQPGRSSKYFQHPAQSVPM